MVQPSAVHRLYDYRTTKFRVSFNAALCYGLNHTVLLSFLDHWTDPERMPEAHMKHKAFLVTKNLSSEMQGIIPLVRTKFTYSISAISNGKIVGHASDQFTMENGHFYVTIRKDKVNLKRLEVLTVEESQAQKGQGKTNDYAPNAVKERVSLTIKMKTPLPRYIALFSTNLQICPAFISAVDSKFDVWLKTRKIDVVGRTPPTPKDTTILRDVILGCLSILFYYYCLTSFILPAYFNYRMPVSGAQAERTAMLRSLEKHILDIPTKIPANV
ncbi:hypothetical protein Aduo_008335 [Ancylostoma duodenale]